MPDRQDDKREERYKDRQQHIISVGIADDARQAEDAESPRQQRREAAQSG